MELETILSNVGKYLKDKDAQMRFFVPFEDEVPVSGGKFNHMDIINLVTAAMSGWVTEGRFCDLFEKKLKKATGLNHAVLCNSGSSANLLAMSAMKEWYDLPSHGLVVTSALGFPTTIAPIMQIGYTPYFVDVDWHTLNPRTSELIELADHPDVKGLIIAHTLGFPIDLRDVAFEYISKNKFVIEDCCDALGSTIDGEPVGQSGNVSTYSFFPAHHISTGEGGAVLCNNGRLMRIIRSYSNWGRDCWCKPGEDNACWKRFDMQFARLPEHYDHKYVTSRIGYNLKMTDLQASLGSAQMDRLPEITKARKDHYAYLEKGFRSILHFDTYFGMVENPYDFSPFGFPLSCLITNRSSIIEFLESRHIRTRPVFAGNATRQPMMDHVNYMSHGTLEGCDFVAENTFWVGCHPELSYSQLDFVISSFKDYLKETHGKN